MNRFSPYASSDFDYSNLASVIETGEKHAAAVFDNETKYKGGEMGFIDIGHFDQEIIPHIPANVANEFLSKYYSAYYSKLHELRLSSAICEMQVRYQREKRMLLLTGTAIFIAMFSLCFLVFSKIF